MGRARLLGCWWFTAVVSCSSPSEPGGGELEVLRTQLEVWANDDSPDGVTVRPKLARDDTSESHADGKALDDERELDEGDDAAPVTAELEQCERFRVEIDEDGRRHYHRIRRTWTKSDQKRFASLVSLVAREMGAEPKLIRRWALRESSYRPHALHLLNPDIEAATTAWRRLYYSPQEEAELESILEHTSKQDPRYWTAKSRLQRVRTFRDNDYLDERVEYELVEPDGTVSKGTEPAWAFGYGPFGFNPAFFVPVWDARSPPWVFCDDDGLAAIITAVWAARIAQRDCERQGFGGSYAVVNKRFGQGHCGVVGPDAKFRATARRLGLDPDARARLGAKWNRADTDRAEILHYMRKKATEADLYPIRDAGS